MSGHFASRAIIVGIIVLFSVVMGLAVRGCQSVRTEARKVTDDLPTTTVPTTPTTTTTTVSEIVPEVQGKTESVAGDDLAQWRAIALCEMPGPGGVPSEPWGAHWSFRGTWSGAFGVYNQTWLGAGGGKYGPTAGHATPDQQIEIARKIRDRYGYGAWGCGRKLGLG
jgi:hypothetical protein